MAADSRIFDNDPANNLGGFSSNTGWADPDSLWSDHPVQSGPKAGFHSPSEPSPSRVQLPVDIQPV